MRKILSFFLVLFFVFPIAIFAKENDEITLYFFHGDGCPHCAEEEIFLKDLEKKYSNFHIERYEVWYNEENAELLSKVEKAFSITRTGVPTNVIGNTVITGYSSSIGSRIERAIEFYQKNDYQDVVFKIKDGSFSKEDLNFENEFEKEEAESDDKMSVDMPLFGKMNLKNFSLVSASAVIGFIDGFNPCAMWVLLFLISVLIGMKDRKRMWGLGLAFLFTSAIFYMLIILSWIQIAVKITTIIWIRNIIAIFAIVGAFINLRSFFKRSSAGCDVVDSKRRKRIFASIRKFTSEKNFFLALIGVIGLAISVNFVELACSAGLPLVFSELLALNYVSNVGRVFYTFIYIFFFLVDDFLVFLIAMLTMKITGISTKYNSYSHLIGGVIMLIIGVLLLFKPGWLMFQFH